tara:strand:+ start:6626 stop:8302 length:1677 start_codon:yes stop_codon:yes gene_type:complete
LSYSQDSFDKKFLEGLPAEIRDDVLVELEKEQPTDGDSALKRRPISAIKLEESKSERFGISFFNSVQSTFMPINDPNIDGNYILDFGDAIELHYTGVINQSSKIQISRDGSINLPKIGPILIAGLSLQQASDFIKNKIKSSLTGVEGHVSLSNLRDIQVLVTGESAFPGVYTLNGNSNLLHVLNISGGITENGSFRSVEIRRNGEMIEQIDLYDLIIFGKSSFNQRLQSGDTIFIPAAKILVRVGAGFNRLGIFEFKENETYKDLFLIAGGQSRQAASSNLILSKYVDGKFISQSISKDQLTLKSVTNDDSIYGEVYKTGNVSLTGMVKNPGKYTISKGETLSSLIKRAGGYTEDAYAFGGQLYRTKAKMLEEQNNINLYNDFIKYIVGSFNNGMTVDSSLPNLLQELKNKKVQGRVRAEFNINKILSDPLLDTLLNDGDSIHIPIYDESIYVYGEIVSSGTTRYMYGKSINEYINATGGLTSYADGTRIVIVDPDGKATLVKTGVFSRDVRFEIYPGSVVYIPRNMTRVNGLQLAGVIAPLFSSLALSLVSISALDD